ncbi:hypothetical protein ABE41_003200 [Fictibacillus arsenicus]|uniref:Uncharacterized protein n=1 Tax=Fictibacillus arsenicus TaxID=255247 RepID=A0A1B1Z0M2_9BACL|nr:hypothetical protein [Fictibacillus arsenicus]ANX11001.1 hypothetical protein ABE41_003200 [Fictibacillus arsenicus]
MGIYEEVPGERYIEEVLNIKFTGTNPFYDQKLIDKTPMMNRYDIILLYKTETIDVDEINQSPSYKISTN